MRYVMIRTCRGLLLGAVVGFMGMSAWAAEPAPPLLPPAVQDSVEGSSLQLLGYGRFRKLLWDVFDASLWVSGTVWNPDQPYALVLRYLRNIDKEDIVDSTRDQLKHLGYTDPAQVNAWAERLLTIFPDIKTGDQLAGVHLVGRETRFFHNGQPVGVVTDPAFGPAFFGIWLDPKSSQPKLREDLIASRCTKPTALVRPEVAACAGATLSAPSTPRAGASQL